MQLILDRVALAMVFAAGCLPPSAGVTFESDSSPSAVMPGEDDDTDGTGSTGDTGQSGSSSPSTSTSTSTTAAGTTAAGGSTGTPVDPSAGTTGAAIQPITYLDYSFATVTYAGQFAPENSGAVWLERADGTYLRTLETWVEVRASHLLEWQTAGGGDVTDAITSASLFTHQGHTGSWNIDDLGGQRVPDGDYTLVIEFTEDNSGEGGNPGGPVVRIPFTVGAGGFTHDSSPTSFANVHVDAG